jgi:hypothetical protein
MSKARPIGPYIVNLPLNYQEREIIAEAARVTGVPVRTWIARIVVGAARYQIASDAVAFVDEDGVVYREPRP